MQFKNSIIFLFFALILVSCTKKKDNPIPPPLRPEISSFSITSKHVGDTNFLIPSPTSTSPKKFTYSSDNNAVAIIKGDSVIIEGAGSATITAVQTEFSGFSSGTITTTFTVLPNIYIAGYSYSPLGARPIIWKNGDTSRLSGYGVVNDMVVQNNHVYIAGSMPGLVYGYPGYWKDGVQHVFPKNGEALAIAVIGNDIYIAGYIDTFDGSNHSLARLWKNGIEIPLTNPFSCCGQTTSSIATGIDVYNNQVFICGTAFNNGYFSSAMIWKVDGTGTAYSKPSTSGLTDTSTMATGIKFQGSEMYVCGITSFEFGNSFLTYWKNGIPMMQSAPETTNSKYISIAIQGTDVYTAGLDGVNGLLSSAYWKNNIETLLTTNAESKRVAIHGNDIYVVGDTYRDANYSVATPVFWLNGNLVNLPAPYNTRASAIAIQDH
jgi:hypothetical protein